MPWPSALINVYQQTHVTIRGKGTLDGDGKIWWDKYWKMRREEYEPKGCAGRRTTIASGRPQPGLAAPQLHA
jgi:hypothetical protein